MQAWGRQEYASPDEYRSSKVSSIAVSRFERGSIVFHLFRYLKVPAASCTGASSGDSVISSSSRDLGIAQSLDDLTSDSSGDELAEGRYPSIDQLASKNITLLNERPRLVPHTLDPSVGTTIAGHCASSVMNNRASFSIFYNSMIF